MAYIQTRFKRITAAFDDDARARLCQSSSGSDHSATNSVTDLSDLIDSFFEADVNDRIESNGEKPLEETEYQDADGFFDTDTKEMLIDLIGGVMDDEDDRTIRTIRFELEAMCRSLNHHSSEGFKRNLMTLLRQKGFDAGLCKSRWEKTGRHPGGEYEYVDVLISGNRYIVEVSLGAEFTIARPNETYESLLEVIPKITVIKPNELKKVVRVMCGAIRASLKSRGMLISPWRKNGYMQSKWFGPYKRTVNDLPLILKPVVGNGDGESLLGFEYAAVGCGKNNCRKEIGRMHVVSNLKVLMLSGTS
ncbi:uncharacterized protein [Rutidosis leptorrhynchoides]|uniref:uncharacterized protein n=1 Tax=Rutidosis leptorrhynchoides TaxID=125765 RepID=UPI003A9965AA